MIKYILITTSLFLSFAAFSQDKQLLKEYKYRINQYKALDLGFNTGGQSNNNYAGYGGSRSIDGGLNVNFFTIKSTDKIYRTINSGVVGNFSSSTENSVTSTNKYKQFYVAPNVNINNKWYAENNFIELGASIKAEINTRNNKIIRGIIAENARSDKNVDINFAIGVGKGRLENITDMQNALWLATILKDDKNLNRKLTKDEVNDLAKVITQSNNFRILDGRKRIQYILTKVDTYLQSKDVVNKTDIKYFSNLNDVVFFANNFYRQAGTIKFIKIIPRLRNNKIMSEQLIAPTNKDINTYFEKEIAVRIGFEKYKPINLVNQFEYGIATNASYLENKNVSKYYANDSLVSDVSNNPNQKRVGVDYFIRYNFYPNTRTIIGFSINGQNGYSIYDNESGIYTGINLLVGANYFISYNTRFVINVSENYAQYIYQSNPFLNQNAYGLSLAFNAGLNISL
jgi:hypothetical protein